MQHFIDIAFGIHDETLTWWQMSLRAVGIFFAALLIIRIGNHRIFGKNTAFDIILGIIYGSILSRAINGSAPFFPSVAAAFTLVLLHKGLAALAYHSHSGIGNLLKGSPKLLVKDGELQRENMRQNSVTEHDLEEAMRSSGNTADPRHIKAAYLERSGDISIIKKDG
ncbi:DUF421 domain-containing protein [Pontibacter chitinilyticus]|uniref:DUF421 domain-containing protein n=1 Tax=Pontibacter chitinilyticus TaxID=2674989 RepID=UPI00321A5E94